MSKSFRNKIIFFVYVLFCVLLVEIGYSTLYRLGIVAPPESIFIQEETEETILFDPVRGYRITEKPARLARITQGELEFLGTFRGNNEGFPDRDDFHPNREQKDKKRFAVFGDSFTAAQFLDTNWPDRAEDLLGEDIELLNFSLDGGGLANWWSVLFRHIAKESYDLDGVIFAVFEEPEFGDLYRGFTISDHRDSIANSFRFKTWEPGTWPKTYEEAVPFFRELPIHILSREKFQATLDGTWHPELPRPWALYGAKQLLGLFRTPEADEKPANRFTFGDPQQKLAREIAKYCNEQKLTVIVVRIPQREALIDGSPTMEDTRLFAEILDGTLFDGADAFTGLGENEIRNLFFPYDGHWNQNGSDRFAEFMKEKIIDVDQPN